MSTLKTYTADSFDKVNSHDAPRSFYEQLFGLQEISIRLSRATTLEDLYRIAVEEAVNTLKIDRLGILLIDGDYMQGTWGTDEVGKVRSETEYRSPMDQEVRDVITELSTRGKVCVWFDTTLHEFSREDTSTNEPIGKGWNAAIGFWEEDTLLGWIACDNFLSKTPFELYFTYILRLFGQLVGELVLKKKAEDAVQALNKDLQAKNSILENTINELNSAQQQLVTAKIQASLKDIVVGVAHELNTPIGVATTALTSAQEKVVEVNTKIADRSLKKSELDAAFVYLDQASELALKNLRSASSLIREFKRLSVFEHQHSSARKDYELREIIRQAIEVCKLANPDFANVKVTVEISKSIERAHTALEPVVQILQDLLLNAFQHGELSILNQLLIQTSADTNTVYIDVINTGKTIDPSLHEKIFDPFVTTARSQGRVGLGLNVARNIASQVLGGDLQLVPHQTDTIFRLSLPR
ncbi:sensor histidine kinase [Salinibius halmophilus]|uniref:sensor histidine kinase n=1 Tax=Salinibius halmophilus TaxID=1853216 RepID=UPI000E672020|nr:HAMP domain-containing sensor histidine kinase [Salinibius halmophilus]